MSVSGVDEINLCEWPICLLSERSDPGLKTVEVADLIYDRDAGRLRPRTVTISGSDKYGLPRAADDDVLIALFQVSDFGTPDVILDRKALIQLMRWSTDGRSYDRLTTSLHRWVGVTLYFDSWVDKSRNGFQLEAMHVLEEIQVGRVTRIVWSGAIQRSFLLRYTKPLNVEFYFSLRSSISRRLYRFLDKRFYRRPVLTMDLRVFAHDKVGLARSYDTAQLKRKLGVGFLELEQEGFLRSVSYAGTQIIIHKAGRAVQPVLDTSVEAYWESLTPEDQQALDQAALSRADADTRSTLAGSTHAGLRSALWKIVRESYIQTLLKKG
jgi:hypothetical protein